MYFETVQYKKINVFKYKSCVAFGVFNNNYTEIAIINTPEKNSFILMKAMRTQ